MDRAFLKELYFRELDRRDQLDAAPTLRIAVLALVGGVFSSYFRALRMDSSILTWIFLSAAMGALVFAVLTVIWIVRSYVGFSWEHLPYASDLGSFYDSLVHYEQTYELASGTADTMFDEDLCLKLQTAATTNAYNNNARSELIYAASRFLAGVVVCTLLGGVPVVIQASEQIMESVRNGQGLAEVASQEGATNE